MFSAVRDASRTQRSRKAVTQEGNSLTDPCLSTGPFQPVRADYLASPVHRRGPVRRQILHLRSSRARALNRPGKGRPEGFVGGADRVYPIAPGGEFELEINRDKSRIVDLKEEGESLDFLKCKFRLDRDLKGLAKKQCLNVFPSEKALLERAGDAA